MSLQSHHTSFVLDSANPTWEGDLLYLLKVAENNPLFRHPNDSELLKVHWDGDKSLAIGYGYDLVQNKARAITDLTAVGITLTPAQIDAINALSGSYTSVPAALASLTLPGEANAVDLLNRALTPRIDAFEDFLSDPRISVLLSDFREKAVLVSMWYHGESKYFGTEANPSNMVRALQNGNRAEVWYEIRCGSSKNGADGPGVVKRRFFEADYFGLYEAGTTATSISEDEAKEVLRAYTRHRDRIIQYEQDWGLTPAWATPGDQEAATNYIEVANGAADGYDRAIANTLEESLQIARTRLIATEVTARGIIRTIDGEVLIGQDVDYVTPKQTYSKDDTTTLVGKDKNDLILGGAGNDRLDGGLGDDILIGGAGVDTYVVQGHDILIDSGRNLIQYNGALIAGVFTGDGSGSTFVGEDGRTLVFNSPGNLTLGATDSITFQNQTGSAAFAGHDFGLFLREPSLAPATTATQVGDSGNNNLSGTAVNDLIVGNGGRDLLQGESGDDVLFADAQITLPAGPGYGGATPYADAVGDFVNGGSGADTLISGALSDALMGGEGDDLRLAA